jgi:rubrerythrin
MNWTFNFKEVMAIAVQLEKNGAEFYGLAKASTDNPKHKKLFENLQEMELDHQISYEKIMNNLDSEKFGSENDYQPGAETLAYLEAFAGGHVFDLNDNPQKQFAKCKNTPEILRMAIQSEKDSIVFYLGIRNMVPPSLGKEQVDSIIDEEMGHIKALSYVLSEIED